jgi:hypothetical protein
MTTDERRTNDPGHQVHVRWSSACFISNQFDGKGVSVFLGGGIHLVPAWSVGTLPDYKAVAYNTAKVLFVCMCNV